MMATQEQIFTDEDGTQYGYVMHEDGRIEGPDVWDALTGEYHGDRERLKRVRTVLGSILPDQLSEAPIAPNAPRSEQATPWPGVAPQPQAEQPGVFIDPRVGSTYTEADLAAMRAQRTSTHNPKQGYQSAKWPGSPMPGAKPTPWPGKS